MYAHRIETIIDETGQLHLQQLPFQQREKVEVIILRRESTNALPSPLVTPCYQIEAVDLGAKRANLDNIAEILNELDAVDKA